MPLIARTIGGPGAGKTHRLLQIVEMVLDKLVGDPLRVGFVSFTRAARREASVRAADKFDCTAADLEKNGWFRTLHSVAYRLLGVDKGQLLAGSKDDNEWLKNILGDERARMSGTGLDDDAFSLPSDQSESCRALSLWDTSRNRLEPLETAWEAAYETDSRTPPLSVCEAVVSQYEHAKREDDRFDFSDLLMRYGGRRWSGSHDAPFETVEPQGSDPMIPVWILDEAQDISKLSALVFSRLIRFATWAYLAGDFWQAIYQWGGCDGSIFQNWEVAKEEILPTSYRCPTNILAAADAVMLRGGHKPRPFTSKDEGGEIVRTDLEAALSSVRVGEKTLVLARTNDYARHAAAYLDDAAIPWKQTKGQPGSDAPARAAGVAALVTLRKGGGIDGEAMYRLMELIPSKAGGTAMFVSGSKKYYKENRETAHAAVPLTLAEIGEAGGTEAFKELVGSGRYTELLEPAAARMARAAEQHGIEAVLNPSVRVGTAHSAKGMESDHVVCINKLPFPTVQAMETEEGLDSERRVWFTAASRARQKLTIAEDGSNSFPDL